MAAQRGGSRRPFSALGAAILVLLIGGGPLLLPLGHPSDVLPALSSSPGDRNLMLDRPATSMLVEIGGLPGVHSPAPGSSLNLTAQVVGGTAPYRYNWTVQGRSIGWRPSPNLTLTLPSVGRYTVAVTVEDATTQLAGAIGNFSSFETSPPNDVVISVRGAGAVVVFSVHLLGGVPPFTYRWTGPGSPTGWSPSATWNATDLPSGRSTVSVEVRDRYNATANGSVDVVNGASPSAPWFDSWLLVLLGGLLGVVLAVPLVYRWRPRSREPPSP